MSSAAITSSGDATAVAVIESGVLSFVLAKAAANITKKINTAIPTNSVFL